MSEQIDESAATAPRRRTRPVHLSRAALVVPVVLVLLGIFLVVGITTMDVVGDGGVFGPTAMPWAVAVLCFVVAGALAVDVLRPRPEYDGPAAVEDTGPDEVPHDAPAESVDARAVATAVGGVAGFILVLPWLGWILSATLLFVAVAHALGNRKPLTSLLIGLALASVVQIVFSGLLGISLPAGFVGGF